MVFDYHKYTRPDGIVEYVQGSNMSFQSDRKVPYEPSFFDFTTLQRFSK